MKFRNMLRSAQGRPTSSTHAHAAGQHFVVHSVEPVLIFYDDVVVYVAIFLIIIFSFMNIIRASLKLLNDFFIIAYNLEVANLYGFWH